jgi:hypothetical protein
MSDDTTMLIDVQVVIVAVLTGLRGRLMLASDSNTLDLPLNWPPSTMVVDRQCGCSAQLKRDGGVGRWGGGGGDLALMAFHCR